MAENDPKVNVVVPSAPQNLSDKPFNEHGIREGTAKVSGIADPHYTVSVRGLTPAMLEYALNQSIESVKQNFPPKTGIAIFAFDYGTSEDGGGLGYIANADRASMIKTIKEWIAHQEREK